MDFTHFNICKLATPEGKIFNRLINVIFNSNSDTDFARVII